MYTQVKERRQTGAGEGNNSKEQRKIPAVVTDFAKVLTVCISEARVSPSLSSFSVRRYFYTLGVRGDVHMQEKSSRTRLVVA